MATGEFKDEVRRLRKEAGLSQTELGAMVGMTQGWVSHIETAEIGIPGSDVMMRLCNALGVSMGHFAPWIAPNLVPTDAVLVSGEGYPLEVLGTVAASSVETPEVFDPPKKIYVAFKPDPKAFALEVRGPSCEPHIPDGSTVVVTPCTERRDTLFNVVRSGSGYTLKLCIDGELYARDKNGIMRRVELEEGAEVVGFVDYFAKHRPRADIPRGKKT